MRSISRALSVLLAAALLLALPALGAEVVQKGNLRVGLEGSISPHVLPRQGAAPVAVSVGGQVTTTDATTPPQLRSLSIQINRHGRLDTTGLPICPLARIQPGSTAHALAACRSSLVGQGHFSANSLLAGTLSPTQGRLLLFNGREAGRPVIYGHIYSTEPFVSSSVIPFRIAQRPAGAFDIELSADLARALGNRDYLTGIEMTLQRRFHHHGPHSFLSAGCPAPHGVSTVPFPLARASFTFAGGVRLAETLNRSCTARG